MQRQNKIRSGVVLSYSNAILDMATGAPFNAARKCVEHKISVTVGTVLKQMGYTEPTVGGLVQWSGPEPDTKMIHKVIENVRLYNITSRQPKQHPSSIQLKIQEPVKEIPVIEDQKPVEPSLVKTQSKVSLIEAAALAAELAVKLGKGNIRGFIEQTLNAE